MDDPQTPDEKAAISRARALHYAQPDGDLVVDGPTFDLVEESMGHVLMYDYESGEPFIAHMRFCPRDRPDAVMFKGRPMVRA